MTSSTRRSMMLAPLAVAAASALPLGTARAQKKYGPGVTDTEIKIGQSLPYSGPASAYGQIGRAEAAYFKWLNAEKGGINGRKINLISLDDGYNPAKVVENIRRLVEQEEVSFIFNMLGTPLNKAVRPYLNQRKIPHLFNAAGSEQFADPKNFPWSMGWQPTLRWEAMTYAKHLQANHPNAKIAVLYQDDDFGKEMLEGLREGLGAKANTILGTQSYQPTDPTMDSQLVSLKATGADTLFLFAYSKQVAQSIRKAAELGWKADIYIHLGSAQIGSTLQPAGLENSIGVKTGGFIKDPTDPQWANDPFIKNWFEWMKKYMPDANTADSMNISGFAYAQTLEHLLRQCGDDLTRENIMRQAASLKDYRNEALLPGSLINTSPTDYRVIEYIKIQRFNGKAWEFV